MAAGQPEYQKKLACELVALSDVELDRYLEENRIEGGASVIHVRDPENLPESFIQRLRERSQKQNSGAQSHAVDLDRVNARLLELPADYNVSPRPLFRAPGDDAPTEPPTPPDVRERRCYDQLVSDGGRPLFPVHLLSDVIGNPKAYSDMLRPWTYNYNAEVAGSEVFSEQFLHWMHFRQWQACNRALEGHRRVQAEAHYRTFISDFQGHCSTYPEAVRKLLSHYGFTQPFQLLRDPKQQDKLSTWIEYLAFTYSFHYHHILWADRFRPAYERAWKRLVTSKLLRPFETEEYVCDIRSAYGRQEERDLAWRAVNSAKGIAKLQSVGDIGGSHGETDVNARAQLDYSMLDAAKNDLAVIERRNRLVTEFKRSAYDYLGSMDQVKYHHLLVQWILDQVPLVGEEMKSNPLEIRPNYPNDSWTEDGKVTDDTHAAMIAGPQESLPDLWRVPEANAKLDYPKILKRNRDDNTDDMPPPTKRHQHTGADRTCDNVGAKHATEECPKESRRLKTAKGGRTDRGKLRTVKKSEDAGSNAAMGPNKSIGRDRIIEGTSKSPELPTPLRRSARIAARRRQSQGATTY